MKHTLLLLAFLPLYVFAHHGDPRERKEAPYAGVKTVKTVTYFTLPKDGNKLDTCSVETDSYNTGGLLTQHDFSMILPKSPRYNSQETYRYASENAWTQQTYKHGVLTDSVLVKGSVAKHYYFSGGKPHALYEYRGDSMQEKMINGGDTIFRSTVLSRYLNRDEFWDYTHAGAFARRAVETGKDGSETVSYYNAQGEQLASYTEHRAGGKVSQVDYYNYGVKRFDFAHLAYSDKLDMTFFLEKSKKGHWSYQVLYTYNDKGQLIEERWIDPDPKRNQVVKKYEYAFY